MDHHLKAMEMLPKPISAKLKVEGTEFLPEDYLMDLIKASMAVKGDQRLKACCTDHPDLGDHRVLILSYDFPHPLLQVVSFCFRLMPFLWSNSTSPPSSLRGECNFLMKVLNQYLPHPLKQSMYKVAKDMDIPFYPMDRFLGNLCFGQGCHGVLFNYGLSQFDSHIGYEIQNNKHVANDVLRGLGYPCAEQRVVSNSNSARQAALELGFPVVVKPLAAGQGQGVSANLNRVEDIPVAFQGAEKYSPKNVIVEKFVEGKDYRITASKGQLSGIVLREPASLIADGKHNIAALIEKGNQSGYEDQEGVVHPIVQPIDDELVRVIGNQGYTLDDRPDQGTRVFLRSNANLSTGGKLIIVEESEVHPDVVNMVHEIASYLRLDSIGLDFISPDISRSWKELGAIIELNCFPMLSERLAVKLFEHHFCHGSRVPIQVIVTHQRECALEEYQRQVVKKGALGYVDAHSSYFNGTDRPTQNQTLYKRCVSLLMNPACIGLTIVIDLDEVLDKGLPLDKIDELWVDQDIKVEDHKVRVIQDRIVQSVSLSVWLSDQVIDRQIKVWKL